jgi:hypothetical protein
MELSADWLRSHLGRRRPPAAVTTPLPPPDATPVQAVEQVSLLERWPVQLAWLLLPALALVVVAVREWRRRGEWEGSAREWLWLGAVVGLDLLALAALAYAVASIVGVDGEGVAAIAGVPVVIVVTWAFTLAAAIVTAVVARIDLTRPSRASVRVACASSAAWLLLVAFWLS